MELVVFVLSIINIRCALLLLQCEKSIDPDSGVDGQPACDLRAVGKKFDKGLYTTLVSTKYILLFSVQLKSVKKCSMLY